MLGGEVVESQQRVAVLAEAVGCLFVFRRVALDEGVERQFGDGLGLGHPNLLQRALGFRLLALRQLGEHVGGLGSGIAQAPAHGTLRQLNVTTFTYTAARGYRGSDSFAIYGI